MTLNVNSLAMLTLLLMSFGRQPIAAEGAPPFKDLWRKHLPEVTQTSEKKRSRGRTVIRCEHPCRKEWGCPEGAEKEYFFVANPVVKTKHPPMYIYLHAAGGHPQKTVPASLPGEFVALFPNSGQSSTHPSWWWGYRNEIRKDPERYRNRYSPTENRILATIEWVVTKFNVDRNRIYLQGYSMGGSGSLGLGMCRGDIFAAMWIGVPATIDHVVHRMGFPPDPPAKAPAELAYLRKVSGYGLPDAPPIVDFMSQTDQWCRQQSSFLRIAQQGKHSVVVAWGPYGHSRDYKVTDGAARSFPWLDIRRNVAYPVFSGATTDQTYPGYKGAGPDQVGQINAYFRWKVRVDTVNRFSVDLWLVDPASLPKPTKAPKESTADVTLRRRQWFATEPDQRIRWTLVTGNTSAGEGIVQTDMLGLVTIPRVTVTRNTRTLMLSTD